MSQSLPPLQPPASKWLQQDNDDSDNDQVGLVPHNRGYKHILFIIIILTFYTNVLLLLLLLLLSLTFFNY
jgi:hypothetical protein